MKIIVCIDNNGGLMFNHRRQSQDSALRAWLYDHFESEDSKDEWQDLVIKRLHLNNYSYNQFTDAPEGSPIVVSETPLEDCTDDEFCFVEDIDITPYLDDIDEFIIINWNRDYPSDTSLDIDFNELRLISCIYIAGSSHEKITIERYKKS